MKKRGRPRTFDQDVALRKAALAFVRHGYSGASVDDLTLAMGMAKPSMYAAFGDKKELFFAALKEHAKDVTKRMQEAFFRGDSLEASLREMFSESVAMYIAPPRPPGCPYVSAAITEAVIDPKMADFTRTFFAICDDGLAHWVKRKMPEGSAVDAHGIARLANGIIHDIALRSRIGETREMLLTLAADGAKALAAAARPLSRAS